MHFYQKFGVETHLINQFLPDFKGSDTRAGPPFKLLDYNAWQGPQALSGEHCLVILIHPKTSEHITRTPMSPKPDLFFRPISGSILNLDRHTLEQSVAEI